MKLLSVVKEQELILIKTWKNSAREKLKKNFGGKYLAEARDIIKDPVNYFEVWQDYRQTAKAHQFFNDLPLTSTDAKKALVVGFGDIYGTKLEAWLGFGLRRAGWQVEALVPKTLYWTQRYFRALGISTFHCPEDHRKDSKLVAQCANDAEEFLSGELNFKSVKNWHYHGVWIGPNLLSSSQRAKRLGSPDLSDPHLLNQLKQNLPGHLHWVHSSRKMLDVIQPNMLYLIEPNYENRPIVDQAIAMGIDVIQFIQPSRDDALIFKRLTVTSSRIHPNSVTKELLTDVAKSEWNETHENQLWEEFSNRYGGKWFLQGRNQPATQEKEPTEIRQQLQLTENKPVAAVFSHILWDANLFYGDDLFDDYADWFQQTVRAACQNENVEWLIKLHPANIWKRELEKDEGELAEITVLKNKNVWPLPPHVHLILPETDISTYSLFKMIDYGITVRGTCGIELPCFGIPTFTAGTGRYSNLGFTYDFQSKDAYLDRLATLETTPPMTECQIQLAKWHAYAIFRLRPWVFSSFRCDFSKGSKSNLLFSNIYPNKENRDLSFQDLELFVDWVRSNQCDYIKNFNVI